MLKKVFRPNPTDWFFNVSIVVRWYRDIVMLTLCIRTVLPYAADEMECPDTLDPAIAFSGWEVTVT